MRTQTRWMLGALAFFALHGACWARAPEPQTMTLLIVPERFSVLQVAFDLVTKRPVALVAYRGEAATERPLLHAWAGDRWVPIAWEDYRGGAFLERQPARIVLVGDDRNLPVSLVKASDWGPRVMSTDAMETDALLNALGRIFDFSRAEWRWFAGRYNMAMEDVSPERAPVSWYDQMTEAGSRPPRRHAAELAPVPMAPLPPEAEPRPRQEEPPAPPAIILPPEIREAKPAPAEPVEADPYVK